MNAALDYTKQKKKFLTVTLIDETVVFLGVPKKALFDKLMSVERKVKESADFEELYGEMTELSAAILSNNKTGKEFTADKVNEIMDIEDMALLVSEYSKFAGTAVNSPN